MNEVLKINQTLDFGKHKGKTIDVVIELDPDYMVWVLDNISKVKLSDRQLNALEVALNKIGPIITFEPPDTLGELMPFKENNLLTQDGLYAIGLQMMETLRQETVRSMCRELEEAVVSDRFLELSLVSSHALDRNRIYVVNSRP